jgi:hypothetical protein
LTNSALCCLCYDFCVQIRPAVSITTKTQICVFHAFSTPASGAPPKVPKEPTGPPSNSRPARLKPIPLLGPAVKNLLPVGAVVLKPIPLLPPPGRGPAPDKGRFRLSRPRLLQNLSPSRGYVDCLLVVARHPVAANVTATARLDWSTASEDPLRRLTGMERSPKPSTRLTAVSEGPALLSL